MNKLTLDGVQRGTYIRRNQVTRTEISTTTARM